MIVLNPTVQGQRNLRLDVLQPFSRLVERPHKLSVYFDLLDAAKLSCSLLSADCLVQVFPAAAKGGIIVLADDDGLVAAQLACHDHRGPSRSLAGCLLQQFVGHLLVVDGDECHAHHRDGADGSVEVLVLEPMQILARAGGG